MNFLPSEHGVTFTGFKNIDRGDSTCIKKKYGGACPRTLLESASRLRHEARYRIRDGHPSTFTI